MGAGGRLPLRPAPKSPGPQVGRPGASEGCSFLRASYGPGASTTEGGKEDSRFGEHPEGSCPLEARFKHRVAQVEPRRGAGQDGAVLAVKPALHRRGRGLLSRGQLLLAGEAPPAKGCFPRPPRFGPERTVPGGLFNRGSCELAPFVNVPPLPARIVKNSLLSTHKLVE